MRYLILIGLSLMLFPSCEKEDPLKLPVDLAFSIKMNKNLKVNNTMVFTKGEIILADFEFEGEREIGEDVYFSKEFSSGLSIDLTNDEKIQELTFEIPQGIYKRIYIAFNTFDDFDQNCIVIEAYYTNTQDVQIPIRFEFLSSEYFSVVAEDYSGDSQIVLNTDTPAYASIRLDPVYWFMNISNTMLDDSETVTINGKATILINEDINTRLYELIVARLDESTECVFF